MKQNKRNLFSIMSIALLLASCGGNTNSTYSDESLESFDSEVRETYDNNISDNELIPDARGTQTADPFVLRFNGKYYLYITTSGGACRCWTSDDMIHWQKVKAKGIDAGYCLQTDKLSSPWAPEVRYYNGKFYLISSFNGTKHYVFTSDYPEGPYSLYTPSGVGNASIDGSIFIDSDEKAYLTYASSSGIKIKRFADDFSSLKEDKFDVGYLSTRLGRWTEGPYITKRYGKYYLTYTGVDCYAPSYRVEYNYFDGDSEKSVFDSAAFKQKGGAILFSTNEDYMGLGHSSNVLGPDLDSYYVSYHNLILNYGSSGSVAKNQRYFNISRLSFNGSTLVADSGDLSNNFVPSRPLFETYDSSKLNKTNDFLLTDDASTSNFSAEYNYTGDDAEFIFSYQNENNYYYVKYEDNEINIFVKNNGNDSLIESIVLNKQYDFSVLHTLRLNYGNNLLHLYFDDIEKLSNKNISLPGGKIGYKTTNASNIEYTALSLVGNGSSDANEYQKHQSLANQYDIKKSKITNSKLEEILSSNTNLNYEHSYNLHLYSNERATFKTYFENEYQNISIRVPATMKGKSIGVKINNGDLKKIKIQDLQYEENEIIVNLGNYKVNKGRNYVSIISLDNETYFSRLDYKNVEDLKSTTYTTKLDVGDVNISWNEHGRNQIDYYNGGLTCSGDDNCFAYIDNYKSLNDCSIEVEVKIKEEVDDKFESLRKSRGTLTSDDESLYYRYGSGVALGVKNHEYYYGGVNYEACINNIQGIIFYINNERVILKEANYSHTEVIYNKAQLFSLNRSYKLKLSRKGNLISAYIDDDLICEYATSTYSTNGDLGLYSFYNECTYNNLTVTK